MTVKEVVKKYLEDKGFDGLYHPVKRCSCALEFDGFMDCLDPSSCEPGYGRECHHDVCDGIYDYCISRSKEKGCHLK
jgi:hypothetical protein